MSCSMMYHTRPHYCTLGDLQAMLKLSYLWGGPILRMKLTENMFWCCLTLLAWLLFLFP